MRVSDAPACLARTAHLLGFAESDLIGTPGTMRQPRTGRSARRKAAWRRRQAWVDVPMTRTDTDAISAWVPASPWDASLSTNSAGNRSGGKGAGLAEGRGSTSGRVPLSSAGPTSNQACHLAHLARLFSSRRRPPRPRPPACSEAHRSEGRSRPSSSQMQKDAAEGSF